MNLRLLSIFKVVAEESSFTQAAKKLYISQPAVSSAIADLEAHLGIPLFDRIGRRIYLNETGQLFYHKVAKFLDMHDDLTHSIKALEEISKLRIGSSITIAQFLLPELMNQYKADQPSTPTEIRVDNAKRIEELLLKHEIDIALIEGTIFHKDLIHHAYASYELSFLCSKSHKFAEVSNVSIEDLLKENLLLREKGSSIRDALDSALLLKNTNLHPAWESINSQALISAVVANLGISFLPTKLVEKELEDGNMKRFTVKGLKLHSYNHLVYHKDKYQGPNFKHFLNLVLDNNRE